MMYRLVDHDNRDDMGAPFEFETATLTEMMPYVNEAIRGDMHPDFVDYVDRGLLYLANEKFDGARRALREVGVYIERKEQSDE